MLQMDFREASDGRGKLISSPQKNTMKIPCFPLESILLALGKTHVDYFSLDVEGAELSILQTIPFDKIGIDTLSVEYVHGVQGKQAYKTFMESHGFVTVKEINVKLPYVRDYIFARKDML